MDNFKNIIGNLELIGAGLFITDNKNISTFGDNSFLSSIKQILANKGNISFPNPDGNVDYISIYILNNDKLENISLNNLTSIGNKSTGSFIEINSNKSLKVFSISKVEKIINKNTITIVDNDLLETIDFNKIKSTSEISIKGNSSLKNINKFNNLEKIIRFLNIIENLNLNNIQFPNLKKLGGSGENEIKNNAVSIKDKSDEWTANPSAPIDISA